MRNNKTLYFYGIATILFLVKSKVISFKEAIEIYNFLKSVLTIKPKPDDYIIIAYDELEGQFHHYFTANDEDQAREVFQATYPDAIIIDVFNG